MGTGLPVHIVTLANGYCFRESAVVFTRSQRRGQEVWAFPIPSVVIPTSHSHPPAHIPLHHHIKGEKKGEREGVREGRERRRVGERRDCRRQREGRITISVHK